MTDRTHVRNEYRYSTFRLKWDETQGLYRSVATARVYRFADHETHEIWKTEDNYGETEGREIIRELSDLVSVVKIPIGHKPRGDGDYYHFRIPGQKEVTFTTTMQRNYTGIVEFERGYRSTRVYRIFQRPYSRSTYVSIKSALESLPAASRNI